MLDRQPEQVALARRAGERRRGVVDPHVDALAYEGQRAIARQRAGQQMGLAQNLEAVADAEDESAVGGEARDALHDRREARDRAASQVIAVAEAAGQDHAVRAAETLVLVPERECVLAHHVAQRVQRVAVIKRAGKRNDAPLHDEAESRRGSQIAPRKGPSPTPSPIFWMGEGSRQQIGAPPFLIPLPDQGEGKRRGVCSSLCKRRDARVQV